MGSASVENATTIRRILRNMELLSGLKVNYKKCSLCGVNVEESRLREMTEILDCRVEEIPFVYLGIKVGINHRKVSEWKEVVNKVRDKIKRWEGTKLSIGGRITLLNSVLPAIPSYYLSFYKIPTRTLREIEKL